MDLCVLQYFLTNYYVNPSNCRTQIKKISWAKLLGSAFSPFPGPLK